MPFWICPFDVSAMSKRKPPSLVSEMVAKARVGAMKRAAMAAVQVAVLRMVLLNVARLDGGGYRR
ncbi:MAG TPA: hypothetical protein DEF51_19005 [Myxococcales bacterium]|nr:hypothetical protein [Myxococcales bacterium]